MTAHDDLRAYLWKNGFAVPDETFVTESGKPYVILTAVWTGQPVPFGYDDLFLGKNRPDTDAFRAYCAKVASQTGKRMRGKSSPPEDPLLLKLAQRLAGGTGTSGHS